MTGRLLAGHRRGARRRAGFISRCAALVPWSLVGACDLHLPAAAAAAIQLSSQPLCPTRTLPAGLALRANVPLGVVLSSGLWAHMTGRKATLADLRQLDPQVGSPAREGHAYNARKNRVREGGDVI